MLVRYNQGVLSESQILNLLNTAGFAVGVGEWRPEKDGAYREAGHAMSQTKTRQLVLQTAWRELQAWKARYRDLKEFSDLFRVIDEVEKNITYRN